MYIHSTPYEGRGLRLTCGGFYYSRRLMGDTRGTGRESRICTPLRDFPLFRAYEGLTVSRQSLEKDPLIVLCMYITDSLGSDM